MSSWRSFKNPLLRGSECRPLLGGLKIHPSSRVYGLLIDLILTGVRNLCPERGMKFWQFTAIQELAQATKITKHKFKH
ncbi:hypothetical protein EGK50_14245 [Enterococcus faecium]|nr:hypothetical protein EGK05_14245 [Enterococcus faecium]RSA88359.1 hypothetical protein EGK50_14245 [Enterococcus faecium]RSD86513.1 hypothetical protein EGP57_14345 [Enterococcus faecium]